MTGDERHIDTGPQILLHGLIQSLSDGVVISLSSYLRASLDALAIEGRG